MTIEQEHSPYRLLPSVDLVMHHAGIAALSTTYAAGAVLALVRDVLSEARAAVAAGRAAPSLESLVLRIEQRVASEWRVGPTKVINATGVILHTNLGRAPLSDDAVEAMRTAAGYTDLEYDRQSGDRGSRQWYVSHQLCTLIGAEAALVTVNAASAVLLALTALARGRDVIVSRGQAVEIGGGFRVPDILEQSGARLLEVGTTNRTRLQDFEDAIGPETAAILHVHTSNFRIVGFTEQAALADLAGLARRRGILLIDDNGSGSLLDTAAYGLSHEPTPAESLAAGAHLVAFSCDKLLGGPQAGVVAGSAELVKRLSQHPLARAFRPDKTILAALSATLLAYLRGDAPSSVPAWRMIGQGADELRIRAAQWCVGATRHGIKVDLIEGRSTVGGGSLPVETLPTTLLRLPASLDSARLRKGKPPVIALLRESRVLLDLRTVLPGQEDQLLRAVRDALEPLSDSAGTGKGPGST
ncbi:MAG: L-seryl-tRNA(Sec) selenium transferase [Chloroflexota bacterium]|nr:L-seryl-tRNA(Sec) selenium transferase [Chloroflexota bacterium]